MKKQTDGNRPTSIDQPKGTDGAPKPGGDRRRMKVKTDLRAGDDIVQGNGSTYP